MGKSKSFWSFWAVVIAGIAYLAAWLFQKFGAGTLASIGMWVAAICGIGAWIIVFVLGWNKVRENNTWMVVVYVICMILIIVFAFLPIIL